MKEYRGESGGRFTYIEDLMYMQELAIAATSLLNEFGDIIIDGISPTSDNKLSDGYIYLNGKIRYFPGGSVDKYPCYIYEKSTKETVMYENEQSKLGRIDFSCALSATPPKDIIDEVTGKNVAYVTIQKDVSKNPTLKNKFFGKYSVLSSPSSKQQVVNGDIKFTGNMFGRDIEIEDSLLVGGGSATSAVHVVAYADKVAVDYMLNNVRHRCMTIYKDDKVELFSGSKKITFEGGKLIIPEVAIGDIHISKEGISKRVGHNNGILKINNNTGKNITNVEIYDGVSQTPVLSINGTPEEGVVVREKLTAERVVSVRDSSTEEGIDGFHTSVEFIDKNNTSLMSIYAENKESGVKTFKSDIAISSKDGKGYIDLIGVIKSNGTRLSEQYAPLKSFKELEDAAVRKEDGKSLSDNNFTDQYKGKIDNIKTGDISTQSDGYVTASDVADNLSKKLDKNKRLSDMEFSEDADEKVQQQRRICETVGAAFTTDVQPKIKDSGWLQMQHPRYGGMSKLLVRQIGSIVTIQGDIQTSDRVGKVFARLPNQISPPKTSVSYIYAAVDGSQKNRGIEMGIYSNSRELVSIREQSADSIDMILTITYMV